MQYAACKRGGSKLTIDISLPVGESILFVNLDAATASLIWICSRTKSSFVNTKPNRKCDFVVKVVQTDFYCCCFFFLQYMKLSLIEKQNNSLR